MAETLVGSIGIIDVQFPITSDVIVPIPSVPIAKVDPASVVCLESITCGAVNSDGNCEMAETLVGSIGIIDVQFPITSDVIVFIPSVPIDKVDPASVVCLVSAICGAVNSDGSCEMAETLVGSIGIIEVQFPVVSDVIVPIPSEPIAKVDPASVVGLVSVICGTVNSDGSC
ncbi:unnamed protein product, partial [Allacma fusca]